MPPNKWDDEESSDGGNPAVAPTVAVRTAKFKWDEEEEEDDEVLDSWDAAADSEEEREKVIREEAAKIEEKEAAAAEKKSRLQRIEEHKVANAAQRAAAEQAKRELENESPAERRRRMQQIEIENDMKVAESLFSNVNLTSPSAEVTAGAKVGSTATKAVISITSSGTGEPRKTVAVETGLGAASDDAAVSASDGAGDGVKRKTISIADPKDSAKAIDLSLLPLFNPKTKEEFTKLRTTLDPLITANKSKAHYQLFVQELVRAMVKDMTSENMRRISTSVSALANERLKEEKAAEKGPKKATKGSKKAQLSQVTKESDRVDLNAYDDYDDYDYDDFM